jgi:hypothetical protein
MTQLDSDLAIEVGMSRKLLVEAPGRCVALGAFANKENRLWMKKGGPEQADSVPWHLAGRE